MASGDTVLLIVDETGMIVDNPRGVDLHDLPVEAGIKAAMAGEIDTRSVTLGDGEDVRVMTAPIVGKLYAEWLTGGAPHEIFNRYTLRRFRDGSGAHHEKEDFNIG